jgi:hypothetical protein
VPLRRLGRCTKFAWERTPNPPRLVLRKSSAMFPDCESRAGTSVVIDNKTLEALLCDYTGKEVVE